MKLLYLIYVQNQGMGGHYYSCIETATKMAEGGYNVSIVSIGKVKSPVLEGSGFDYEHISDKNIFLIRKQLIRLFDDYNADIIHCFDTESYFWGRVIASKDKKIMLTKCGGPNPKRFFPYVQNLVLFSKENFHFFSKQKKFDNSRLYFLPNRVNPNKIPYSQNKVEKIRKLVREDALIFVRINRISSSYENIIKQTIYLVERLNDKGLICDLVIIGTIEDRLVYERLKESIKSHVHFLTDDEFTIRAAKNLEAADFVIGTGRGFMEAALKDKVMLVPTNNRKFPELVSENNFYKAFDKNFSPRYCTDKDDELLFGEVTDAVKKHRENNRISISGLANENFSSNFIYEKLNIVYLSLNKNNEKTMDFLIHAYWMIRYYVACRIRK